MVAGGRYALDPRYRVHPTIVHALDDAANRLPDRTALIVQDRRLTYRQYRSAAAGMARHLLSLGAHGQAVAICMGNGLEAAVAIHGAMAAGALAAPINPNYTPAELRPLVDKVHQHAYQVTDQEIAALRKKYSDDELFEVIVAAATGAAGERLDAALRALEEATT